MDVRCTRCGTEYEFDDALISERGTSVRCTQCGFQFKVFPPQVAKMGPDEWVVLTSLGRRIVYRTLRELQNGISKSEVAREDLLARGSKPPRPLGSIAELDPLFAVKAAPDRQPSTLTGVAPPPAHAGPKAIPPPGGSLGRQGHDTFSGVAPPANSPAGGSSEALPSDARNEVARAAPPLRVGGTRTVLGIGTNVDVAIRPRVSELADELVGSNATPSSSGAPETRSFESLSPDAIVPALGDEFLIAATSLPPSNPSPAASSEVHAAGANVPKAAPPPRRARFETGSGEALLNGSPLPAAPSEELTAPLEVVPEAASAQQPAPLLVRPEPHPPKLDRANRPPGKSSGNIAAAGALEAPPNETALAKVRLTSKAVAVPSNAGAASDPPTARWSGQSLERQPAPPQPDGTELQKASVSLPATARSVDLAIPGASTASASTAALETSKSLAGSTATQESSAAKGKPEEPTAIAASSAVASKTLGDPVASKTLADPVASKTLADPVASKTLADPVASKTLADPVASKTLANPVASKTLAGSTSSQESSAAKGKPEEPTAIAASSAVASKTLGDPVASKPQPGATAAEQSSAAKGKPEERNLSGKAAERNRTVARHDGETPLTSRSRSKLPAASVHARQVSDPAPRDSQRSRPMFSAGRLFIATSLLALGLFAGMKIVGTQLHSQKSLPPPAHEPSALPPVTVPAAWEAQAVEALRVGDERGAEQSLSRVTTADQAQLKFRNLRVESHVLSANMVWWKVQLIGKNAGDDYTRSKQLLAERLERLRTDFAALGPAADWSEPVLAASLDARRMQGDKSEPSEPAIVERLKQPVTPELKVTQLVLAWVRAGHPDDATVAGLRQLRAPQLDLGPRAVALVVALAQLNRFDEAKAELQRLVTQASPHPLLGEMQAYVRNAEQAHADSPADPAGDTSVLADHGEPGESDPALLEGDFRLRLTRASECLSRNELTKAQKLLRSVLAQRPNDTEAITAMGDVMRRRGDLTQSRSLYDKALALNANYLPAMSGAADLRWKSGDRAGAAALYRRILERVGETPGYGQLAAARLKEVEAAAKSSAEPSTATEREKPAPSKSDAVAHPDKNIAKEVP